MKLKNGVANLKKYSAFPEKFPAEFFNKLLGGFYRIKGLISKLLRRENPNFIFSYKSWQGMLP